MALGKDEEAMRLVDRSLIEHPEDRGGVITSSRAILKAKRGDARGAESDIQAAIPKGEGYVHFHHTEYNIAVAYALLHRPAAALPWLQRTVRDGWPCYPLFASDPRLDPIRAMPAFVAFLRERNIGKAISAEQTLGRADGTAYFDFRHVCNAPTNGIDDYCDGDMTVLQAYRASQANGFTSVLNDQTATGSRIRSGDRRDGRGL